MIRCLPCPACSWVVGSACETGVSVTRSLVNSTTGELLDTTTITQLSISLTCGTVYKPARTEINQDIVKDNLQVCWAWARVAGGIYDLLRSTEITLYYFAMHEVSMYLPHWMHVRFPPSLLVSFQIGYTYRFCVVVSGDSANKYSLDASDPLRQTRFVSPPECRDVKIAWTAKISGQASLMFCARIPFRRSDG